MTCSKVVHVQRHQKKPSSQLRIGGCGVVKFDGHCIGRPSGEDHAKKVMGLPLAEYCLILSRECLPSLATRRILRPCDTFFLEPRALRWLSSICSADTRKQGTYLRLRIGHREFRNRPENRSLRSSSSKVAMARRCEIYSEKGNNNSTIAV
jgi:hypothetical protein